MYRWLSREFTTVECTRTCEQRIVCNRQSMHIEAVTAGRETAANHLAYTLLCMFLAAELYVQNNLFSIINCFYYYYVS